MTEISNFAGRSEFTKIEGVAVSVKVPVGDTSRAISTFSIAFDRLQTGLMAQVVQDYIAMRSGYVISYEQNMRDNEDRKNMRILESQRKIGQKEKTIEFY